MSNRSSTGEGGERIGHIITRVYVWDERGLRAVVVGRNVGTVPVTRAVVGVRIRRQEVRSIVAILWGVIIDIVQVIIP
jgi:hypothetical protein